MPARIVVVLDDPGIADQIAAAFADAAYDAMAFANPMTALDALEKAERTDLLITSPNFAPGQPNGVALARMTRWRRPGLKVLFIGPDDVAKHTVGVGEFMPSEVTVPQVVERAMQLLEPDNKN
jgi:DNA-binding NtrC family response regulator